MDTLVTPDWLAAEIGAPDLRIVDATYFALEPDRDARAAYLAGHIPGAVFLDLETLADPETDLPGMVPPADLIAARLSALGISNDDRIILYDQAPHHTAMRAWWLLRLFGARRIAVLDGGLMGWTGSARPIETGEGDPPEPGRFAATIDPATLRTLDQVLTTDAQLVDARGAKRFTGEEADPRPGVAPGHIPGSRNLPYGALIGPDRRLKDAAALRAAFEDAGVDLDRPVVTTCGSGVTAAILLFALHRIGKADVALYDGSWSEWGADPAMPKAIGPA